MKVDAVHILQLGFIATLLARIVSTSVAFVMSPPGTVTMTTKPSTLLHKVPCHPLLGSKHNQNEIGATTQGYSDAKYKTVSKEIPKTSQTRMLDLNQSFNDGKVDQEEWEKAADMGMSLLDLNRDGKIDHKDLKKMAELFTVPLDLNNDGKVDEEDLKVAADRFLSQLDLNKDGKIDGDDWNVLKDRIETCLDVNGDGTIDAKDAQLFLKFAAFSGALLASPLSAQAKGGSGHGGGRSGHISSHRSYSHRGSHRSGRNSSSFNTGERDLYIRSEEWKQKDELSWHPRSCLNAPQEGETLKVYIPSADKYVPATVTRVNESKCKFVATPVQDEYPTKQYSMNRMGGFYLLLGIWSIPGLTNVINDIYPHDADFYKKMIKFQLSPNPNLLAISPPKNGLYVGKSTESKDEVVQEVNTIFEFKNDGTIVGSGVDAIDGRYSVEGKWRESQENREYVFLWKEKYSSYSVTVVGEMKKPSKKSKDTIMGRFRSSHARPAKGSFQIHIIEPQ